ncbi:cathepsin B-like [Ischnura elegans]|uniref:cathepsin B-like n=1 Tax=Ischnura elegans TaxID=197161 RepID=UPI001ED87785|nr:cathepsin B-like [Ischnura elegans]
MWVYSLLLLVVGVLGSLDPLSDEFVEKINSLGTTWEAGRNFGPHVPMAHIRNLMGVPRDFRENSATKRPPEKSHFLIRNEILPENFDARKQWPNCPTISEIRDQGSCGSCWAVAAAEAMSDRVCIHSKGKENFRFSAENILSCCQTLSNGCGGGYPAAAWGYWVYRGIVSGGSYGSNQGCQPYPFEPCEHHINGSRPACTGDNGTTPPCHHSCDGSYKVAYEKDLHYGQKAYAVPYHEIQIQKEIMTNGPVEAAFMVYEDFITYKKGVYQHVAGSELGGHAVRIIGWGVDKEAGNVPYWLIANSWNTDWGDGGCFKILRGKNECGIEGSIVAGLPKLTVK